MYSSPQSERSDIKHQKAKTKQSQKKTQINNKKIHKNLSVDTEDKYIPCKHGLLCSFIKNGLLQKYYFQHYKCGLLPQFLKKCLPQCFSQTFKSQLNKNKWHSSFLQNCTFNIISLAFLTRHETLSDRVIKYS